jgi:hypothetical protein
MCGFGGMGAKRREGEGRADKWGSLQGHITYNLSVYSL